MVQSPASTESRRRTGDAPARGLRASLRRLPLVLLCSGAGWVGAQGTTYTWALPQRSSDIARADFTLWMPPTLGAKDTIRGVLCATYYDASTELFNNAEWRKRATDRKFPLMLYNIERAENGQRARELRLSKSENGAKAILAALKHFAAETRHPELEFAGIVPSGTSQGGWQAVAFSTWIPDRVIAALPIHEATAGRAPTLADSPNGHRVPMLHMLGGKDFLLEGIDNWVRKRARPLGALWGTHYNFRLGHPDPGRAPGQQKPILDWLMAVWDLRVPRTIPVGQAYALKNLREQDGWLASYSITTQPNGNKVLSDIRLGSYATFAGNKDQAVWFPTEALARTTLNFGSEITTPTALQAAICGTPSCAAERPALQVSAGFGHPVFRLSGDHRLRDLRGRTGSRLPTVQHADIPQEEIR